MENFAGVLKHQFDACFLVWPAADQVRTPAMRHRKRGGCERALRRIAEQLVTADPIIPLVLALHIAAPRGDRVSLYGLSLERIAFGRPILRHARLEIEIQRLAR